tara:strand:- start:6 stop:500 length:495 start_codon:yes stop_codon:yes gene_type:complete
MITGGSVWISCFVAIIAAFTIYNTHKYYRIMKSLIKISKLNKSGLIYLARDIIVKRKDTVNTLCTKYKHSPEDIIVSALIYDLFFTDTVLDILDEKDLSDFRRYIKLIKMICNNHNIITPPVYREFSIMGLSAILTSAETMSSTYTSIVDHLSYSAVIMESKGY